MFSALLRVAKNENGLVPHKRRAWIQEEDFRSRKKKFHISSTKARSDKKHSTFHVLLSCVLSNSSVESLQIKAWSRLMGLAEEVGFEPTARSRSSIAVHQRPPRTQKAHPESTDIHEYTLSSAGSAVTTAVKKNLLM